MIYKALFFVACCIKTFYLVFAKLQIYTIINVCGENRDQQMNNTNNRKLTNNFRNKFFTDFLRCLLVSLLN